MMDDQSLLPTWRDAFSIVGTVVGAFIGFQGALWKDREVRKIEVDRHARYGAIRVVCELDRFISECGDVVYDEGLPDADGYAQPRVGTPTIAFPEDVDWKSIEPSLMYRAVGLPNKITYAKQSLEFVRDQVAGPPFYEEYFEERAFHYATLGLEALTLADEYRGTYGIPRQDFGGWQPREALEQFVAQIKEAREKQAAKHAQMAEKLNENAGTPEAAGPRGDDAHGP